MRRILLSVILVPLLATSASADMTGTGAGFSIPDGTGPPGASSSISFAANEIISDITVDLNDINHTWVGDLIVTLQGPAASIDLMFRTRSATGTTGGDSSDLDGTYSFGDAGGDWWAEAAAGDNSYVMTPGLYQPTTATGTVVSFGSVFGGMGTQGTWTLFISDSATQDTGSLASWDINFTSSIIPEPATFGLLGIAGLGFGLVRRRRSC